MAIAFDASSTGNTANSSIPSPLTWSHTVASGSNMYLVVFVEHDASDAVTGVTYNSVSMTQLLKYSDSFGKFYYAYGLSSPSTGANNISVSWSGGNNFVSANGLSYSGVSSTGQPDATGTANATSGTSLSANITVVASNCWIAAYSRFSSGITGFTGYSTRKTDGLGGQMAAGDSNAVVSTGSQNVTATGTNSGVIAVIALSLLPFVNEIKTKGMTTNTKFWGG